MTHTYKPLEGKIGAQDAYIHVCMLLEAKIRTMMHIRHWKLKYAPWPIYTPLEAKTG